MIKRIKEFCKLFLGDIRQLFALYRYDMMLYKKHSCMNDANPNIIATKIRLLAHALEKGMSLPNPRAGFGREKVLFLIELCNEYNLMKGASDTQAISVAKGVVSSYIKFQESHGVDVNFIPEFFRKECSEDTTGGGTIHIVRGQATTRFSEIAHKRHSLRYFSPTPVRQSDIENAVALAQTAPSACNRQPINIYACTQSDRIDEILKLHGGMRGFGKPTVIFAITGDLVLYQGEYERNTVFVDGGLFCMNLLYALDSYGIASCPIIWGCNPSDDKKMGKIMGIPESHKICILVAAGYFPGVEYDVAASVRRNINDILHII